MKPLIILHAIFWEKTIFSKSPQEFCASTKMKCGKKEKNFIDWITDSFQKKISENRIEQIVIKLLF